MPGSTGSRCASSLGDKRKEISAAQIDDDHPALRRLHRGRTGQDLPQRGVRLPADHRGAATAAAMGGHRRHPGADGRDEGSGPSLTEDDRTSCRSRYERPGGHDRRRTRGAWSRSSGRCPRPSRRHCGTSLAVADPEAPVVTTARVSQNRTLTFGTTKTCHCPACR